MIETVAQTGSTNSDLLGRLAAGETLPEGFWLRAVQQSAGRGRSGRNWLSAPGNLYTSTVVHLRAEDPPAHTLSLVAGLAVWDSLRAIIGDEHELFLKWPNDVLVRDAKIAGILLERSGDAVVVGIGVNVGYAPALPDRATSCIRAIEPGTRVGPPRMLDVLAVQMEAALIRWRSEGLASILQRWSLRAHPIGTALSVKDGDGMALTGSFAGLDDHGSLLLRLVSGEVRTIHAGDVSMIAKGPA